jgi:DNA/RNA endonuclease YhcR with UshA esterase domain
MDYQKKTKGNLQHFRNRLSVSMIKFLSFSGFLAGCYFLSVTAGLCGKPQEIEVNQVGQHIGEEVIVRGTVTQVARSHHEVFICFGGKYPEQVFKGFIPAGSPIGRNKTLDSLEGKKIGIFGKITTYNGKAEIDISSMTQVLP